MKPYYQDDRVTLYHGDCLEVDEWMSADTLVFDPPYGISWKKGTNRKAKSYAHEGIANDADTAVRDAVLTSWGERPSATFGSWRASFPPHRQVLVWRKPVDAGLVGSVTGWRNDTELVFLNGAWPKRNAQSSSVLETDGSMHAYLSGHPHSKPVPILQHLISASPGVIADPTAGGGSTAVAAASLGRQVIAVELEERYCELIAKRVSQQAFDLEGIA